jgi:amino acid adenylation domain-containing protein
MGETQLPASHAQEQVWFIDNFHDGFPAHNLPHLVWLRGPLDVPALSRALDGVTARHDALRTRLATGPGGRPVQVIDPPADAGLELTDVSGQGVQAARELAAQEALRPFQLATDRPLRARLLRLAPGEHLLTIVAHRALVDDFSIRIVLSELAELYAAQASGQPARLAPPSAQFGDYATWERQYLQGPVLSGLQDYWRDALAGLPASRFPADRPRPLLASHDGAVEAVTLDGELLEGLRELSHQAGATLAVTLLAALLALLQRYTGQSDLVAGLASDNRVRPELTAAVGLLANTLPVRADLSEDPPFTELVARVREAAAGAQAHQDLPFAKIVDVLRLERDPGRYPVFQIGFEYAEPVPDGEWAGVSFRHERAELRALQYDLSFVAEPRDEGLRIEASYPPALFDAATVTRLLGHLEVLLRAVVADPPARLSALPVLTEAELHQELTAWNDTAREFPVTCIHEGFEQRVRQDPHAVAAEFEGECWSYQQLNRRANQVARRLRAAGAGPETLVGVCLPVSLERLAALLGVWKAGGGYVPLDPGLPAERLAFLVADTAMPVVVTDEASAAGLPAAVAQVSLDGERDEIAGLEDSDLPGTGAQPSNVAYVIYTSGSTGEPKGVVVEHRQALNFLHGMAEHWRIGPGAAVLSFAAFTFDVSVMDMFMPLLGGARVVLAAPPTLHSPPLLAELIREAGVTFACLPPAVLNLLTGEEFPGLRTLLSAGEELTSELLRAWLRQGQLEIYNGYGPTEASIGSTFMRMDADTQLPPPIGRPKPNYQAYVLDGYLNPVPVGVIGELHIGGAGVARGYLNRPELTRERFIADPFRLGGRLYKTGDLVRRRPDGTIAFVGRADNQVKIRGLRVELGEIEAALASYPAVAQAVVTVISDPAGGKQLAAYVRPAPGGAPAPAELRDHLSDLLPGYMVPSYLMVVDEFPLTRHGKIDKATLPEPQAIGAGGVRVPPATIIETVLVDMYATVLGHEHVGATDSFFDIGGNSLQAMQLITQLRAGLAVELDIAAVFLSPTPRQLATLLRDKHGFDDEELGSGGIDEITPLPGQQDDGTIPEALPC